MSIFHVVLFVIAILQAACVGSRTFTEQEQVMLAQTKTIWVDVRSNARELPTGIAPLIEKIEHNVKDRLTRAGFTVASDWSTADAILQLAFDFSDRRRPDELSSSYDSPYRQDAHSIHIGASLDHKEVGHVFWHGGSVSPPYDVSLTNSLILSSIDSDVLQALFKPKPPAAGK